MSVEQNVQTFLLDHASRPFCDDCLSNILKVRPRQQIQQKTSKLAKSPLFRRNFGTCVHCKTAKLLIQTRNSVGRDESSPDKHQQKAPGPTQSNTQFERDSGAILRCTGGRAGRAQRLICWAVVIARLARIKDSKP
jgi:hypothetical protein